MYDICTIGPISHDTIINADTTRHMPGGTAYYIANALQHFPLKQQVITVLAAKDHALAESIRTAGIDVQILPSHHTVSFENKYGAEQCDPEQRVRHQSSPFALEHMPPLSARLVHLGPLLNHDIPLALLKKLAETNRISLDIQGYLRTVSNHKVVYQDWSAKKEALPLVSILKANEMEMGVLTGQKNAREGALYLADMGVAEVVITLGSKGSLVYSDGIFHTVRAFSPTMVVDTTGCGDTYMAGYLAQRVRGVDVARAAEFGAAMASLKVSTFGPFCGPPKMVDSQLMA